MAWTPNNSFKESVSMLLVKHKLLTIFLMVILLSVFYLSLSNKQYKLTEPSQIKSTTNINPTNVKKTVSVNGEEYSCLTITKEDENNIKLLDDLISSFKQIGEKSIEGYEGKFTTCGTESEFDYSNSYLIPSDIKGLMEEYHRTKTYTVRDFQKCREFWSNAKNKSLTETNAQIEINQKQLDRTLSKNNCVLVGSPLEQLSELKDEFNQNNFPNFKPQEQAQKNLKEFLIKDYYSNNNYENECIKNNLNCVLGDYDFKSRPVDLNVDGKNEYIVMPWKMCACYMRGASGNGDLLVVRIKDKKYEVIGNLINSNGYSLSSKKTNGYYDIITNSHGSAVTGTETLYKYQTFSNGIKTGGEYEAAFSKFYDLSKD